MLIDHFNEQDLMDFPDNQTPGEVYARLKAETDLISARLEELKQMIINQYEENPDSVIGVNVVQTKGRSTVKWAEIAEELHIPDEVIAKHTKIGKPGYMVKIPKPKKDDVEPQKYY